MAKGLSHACSSWTLLGISFLKTGKNGGPQPKGERRGLSFFLSHPHCLYAAGRGDEAPYSRLTEGAALIAHTHTEDNRASFTGCAAKLPLLRRLAASVLTLFQSDKGNIHLLCVTYWWRPRYP